MDAWRLGLLHKQLGEWQSLIHKVLTNSPPSTSTELTRMKMLGSALTADVDEIHIDARTWEFLRFAPLTKSGDVEEGLFEEGSQATLEPEFRVVEEEIPDPRIIAFAGVMDALGEDKW